jgi:hypothetical protein
MWRVYLIGRACRFIRAGSWAEAFLRALNRFGDSVLRVGLVGDDTGE